MEDFNKEIQIQKPMLDDFQPANCFEIDTTELILSMFPSFALNIHAFFIHKIAFLHKNLLPSIHNPTQTTP